MANFITFVPCCAPIEEDNYAIFIGSPIVGMPNGTTWVYFGATITGGGSGPWNQLINGQCYTVYYNPIIPTAAPVFTLTVSSFSNSSIYFPSGNTCYESLYCQRGCIPECFKLWPCDGSIAPFTTFTDLSGFIGNNIIVSSVDPSYNIDNICVFVENISNNNCANSIDIIIDANECECPCICYTIIGEIKSVDWIDCFGVYNLVATPLSPFEICAGAYPLAVPLSESNPLQIISNGLCLESTIFNDETCNEELVFNCAPACYKLQECFNPSNVIYSNSTSLLGPATLGQVVTIAGYTECWEILIPEECICPINVTVLTVSNCCEACLPNINYKLTLCNDSTAFTYTSDDLSLYVDKVIRREDCPEECWIVSQIDGNIPTDIPIVVIEDYLDCTLCYRKYYRLQDCLDLELNIITYTDLSDYVDKIITLDWCPETCWTVTETIEDDGAGIISDVLNSYTECIDCLTSAPCVCSTIKNYNDASQTYQYLNCEGILQTVTLQPGQKSDRLCLIRWYTPKNCESFIVKQVYSNGNILYHAYSNDNLGSPVPIPNYLNGKPTFYSTALQDFIYYDGKKWILSIYDGSEDKYIPVATLECGADCNCPIGSWINISSLPNQTSNTTIEYKYTIEYFGNCINGVCPPRKNKQKSVTPGYDTPGCEAWKYEEISCRAAEALYKQVLQLRYGISNCCPEEDERYIIQKELIDLQAMIPPDETPSPPLPPVTSYNCVYGNCVLVSGSSGEYPTLAACEEECTPLPIISYNCIDNTCVDPGDGTGEYPTLLECEDNCEEVTTYDCIDGECVEVQGSGGQFPTYINCYDSLIITNDSCEDKVYTGVTIISLTDPYSWVAINHPNNNFDNYTFSCNNCGFCTNSNSCPSPDNGCLVYCSFVTVVNSFGVLFTAYTANDLINYLNTNYPSCGPFLLSDTFAEINAILGDCPESENTSLNYITGICTCDTACVPTTSWNCVDCECESVSGSGGTYPTEIDCLESTCSQFFITTWTTTISSESITLPYIASGTYSGTIKWGDGEPGSVNSYANRTHTYAVAGTYTIIICGTTNGWNFSTTPTSRTKIKSVENWGQLLLGSNTGGYFNGCSNLTLSSVIGTLNLTGITNMQNMFVGCSSITTINGINSWSTSAITNTVYMFSACVSFSQALSFDTSAVTNMYAMFNNCIVFNQPITFNTISVMSMSFMFSNCNLFNQPLSFNTSAVTNMQGMFQVCTALNSPLIFTSTANVTDMSFMFANCTAFNQTLSFNTLAVEYMNNMFANCSAFNSVLTFTSTSAVTNMSYMFSGCVAFNQNIGTWNVANVSDFSGFMQGKTPATWPTTYFDNLLCGWSPQIVQPGLTINFGTANYTNATGGPCRTILQSPPNNWTINSGPGV